MEFQKVVVTGVDKNEIHNQLGPQAISDGVHHDAISGGSPSAPTIQSAEGRDQRQKQLNSTLSSLEPTGKKQGPSYHSYHKAAQYRTDS